MILQNYLIVLRIFKKNRISKDYIGQIVQICTLIIYTVLLQQNNDQVLKNILNVNR